MFADRVDAGRRLGTRMKSILSRPAPPATDLLVLAIPRGGVVVGAEVATALSSPLDLVIPRKVATPFSEELAIGAVTEDGLVLIDDALVDRLGISKEYIREEADRQLAEIRRRMDRYRGRRPLPEIAGKTVILVDDGIATGHTVRAALKSLRRRHPGHLVLAVPVAPPDTLGELEPLADRTVCLESPEFFAAVGQFYEDFSQTTDQEVIDLLTRHSRASPGKPIEATTAGPPAER